MPLMIDSGAYSAWRKGETLSVDEYVRFIYDNGLNRPGVIVVSLDVINEGQASYENWKEMRKQGIEALPVYHVATDVRFLKLYLKEVQYIGIGAIANLDSNRRRISLDRIWQDFLIDCDNMPFVRTHGMGITSFSLMKQYPWFSVDSTSWLMNGAYGKIYVPKKVGGDFSYTDTPLIIPISDDSSLVTKKGKHFKTMSSALVDHVTGYLDHLNVPIEEVRQNHVVRCEVNAFFFSQFASNMEWPRPFVSYRRPGFFEL